MFKPKSPYRLCQALLSQTSLQQQQRCFQTHPTLQIHDQKFLHTSFDDLLLTDLAAYWDTTPPNPVQIQSAERFFAHTRHSPVKLYSAAQFRTIPFDSKEPEVAFLGKTNVGKSSLINALVDDEICRSGDKRGKTTEMNAYGIGGTKGGESKIVLLDMPGYGAGSRPEQGEEIMKYLKNRKQLRRTYILIDLLHGIKPHDQQILTLLRQYAIPHQLIVSKVDRILCDKIKSIKHWHYNRKIKLSKLSKLQQELEKLRAYDRIPSNPEDRNYEFAAALAATKGPPPLGEIICVSAMTDVAGSMKKSFLGINALRWSIMQATGFDGSVQSVIPPV
ncbi:GTP binding protein (EngB), putative [Talaromyces stipitatus ATCC 10500]|uniref:GTP binding protein (EngB), putative n=1 Tax=Talaromyces stipitatus (strain ATCC 10500 / CBS 375.48 / QM 6759 / NRRL 1006) TaxID=441959 RepID=B8MAK6_TALSN|nr:GTP binding protein (EngB), putative [Talaromyces stipitatus ATCC 10500]EED17430.1 GTP binding protein (EngB), putative [Talaromyces stipitatus ATCC 10500]